MLWHRYSSLINNANETKLLILKKNGKIFFLKFSSNLFLNLGNITSSSFFLQEKNLISSWTKVSDAVLDFVEFMRSVIVR